MNDAAVAKNAPLTQAQARAIALGLGLPTLGAALAMTAFNAALAWRLAETFLEGLSLVFVSLIVSMLAAALPVIAYQHWSSFAAKATLAAWTPVFLMAACAALAPAPAAGPGAADAEEIARLQARLNQAAERFANPAKPQPAELVKAVVRDQDAVKAELRRAIERVSQEVWWSSNACASGADAGCAQVQTLRNELKTAPARGQRPAAAQTAPDAAQLSQLQRSPVAGSGFGLFNLAKLAVCVIAVFGAPFSYSALLQTGWGPEPQAAETPQPAAAFEPPLRQNASTPAAKAFRAWLQEAAHINHGAATPLVEACAHYLLWCRGAGVETVDGETFKAGMAEHVRARGGSLTLDGDVWLLTGVEVLAVASQNAA